MKINFDYEFKDENGRPIVIGEKKEPATLKAVAKMSLLHGGDQGQDAKQKRHRYELAAKIHNFGSSAVLDQDDIEMLKLMIGVAMVPLVVGPAMAILEGQEPLAIA